jgi:hypothetical protein
VAVVGAEVMVLVATVESLARAVAPLVLEWQEAGSAEVGREVGC